MAGRVCRYLAAAFAIAWLGAMAVSVQAQTLERIAASKTVRIGYIADQAPFASKDANGQPTGFAIDLCAMVVAGLGAGLNIVYVETDLGDAFAEIAADRIDMLCGAVTATLGAGTKTECMATPDGTRRGTAPSVKKCTAVAPATCGHAPSAPPVGCTRSMAF